MIAYLQNIAVLFCINGILALTLNFIMGYAGIFSLAHAVFFGVGAYATAYIALNFSDSLLLCLLASAMISGLRSRCQLYVCEVNTLSPPRLVCKSLA
jgi:branched-chain amino acid transport system permease protein